MHSLLRSTPFRVAVIVGATVLVSLVIAGLVAVQLIQTELAQRMDRAIADDFKVIAEAYGEGDTVDMIDSVTSHAAAAPNRDWIFVLMQPDGTMLAGNVTRVPAGGGWMTVPAAELGLAESAGRYRLRIGDVAGNRLAVGQSFAESGDIVRLALGSIAWAGAVIMVLVAAMGTLIALRGRRRISNIAETMERVGRGELSARINVGPRADDIDLLSRQVNAALDRLSALVEGMRQVSVNIAHDLKTPLNRLAISIETASAAAGGEPLVGLLGQATSEIAQINATFDALLRIAQIEAGARRGRFVPTDIASVLARIADAYVDVAEEQRQTLVVQWDEGLPPIEGDAELLTQLCANLVENALRHTPPGTQISLTARNADDALVLVCADNGPGIAESERSRVFERLYRGDKSRSTPGSGLGLSLVKAIVELHGATIVLEDNAPGLRVAVRFPR
ncbi:MAG: HAMP domain-containing sensor histidine kinase [Devosia sp.]